MGCHISCIKILYLVVLWEIICNYMLRINISIAITEMVETRNTTDENYPTNKFDWSVKQKHDLLGCIFWGYAASTLVTGILCKKFGPRKIIGTTLGLAGLLTVIIPMACYANYYFALVCRILLGGCLGLTNMSLFPLIVKWIPPLDRSKFTSCFTAQSIGVILTLPFCGYIIYYLGWEWCFYITGLLGILSSVLWFSLVYDSPEDHPRISIKEKASITRRMNIIEVEIRRPDSVPWVKFLTSIRVWSCFVVQCSVALTYLILMSELPTYMKDVYKLNIKENGLLSSIPYLGQYLFSLLVSYLADKTMKSGKLSVLNTRKICVGISLFIPALALFTLATWKVSKTVAIILLLCTLSSKGAMSAGHMANYMDIVPNHCAFVSSFAAGMGMVSGSLGITLVGILTKEKSDFFTWGYVFYIKSAMSLSSGIFFMIFAAGEQQPWDANEDIVVIEEEAKKLNTDNNKKENVNKDSEIEKLNNKDDIIK